MLLSHLLLTMVRVLLEGNQMKNLKSDYSFNFPPAVTSNGPWPNIPKKELKVNFISYKSFPKVFHHLKNYF